MQRVLIIGKVWPESRSSAAGSRMMQVIHLFLEQDWQVNFASAANESEFSDDLARLAVSKHKIELNNSSFDRFVKELQPTLVLFDRFTSEEQFGWRVAEQCPDALRILDTEDLHCLRAARQLAVKEKRDFEKNDLMNPVSMRELAGIYRCDLSLIISDVELNLLKDFFRVDAALLHYLPFMLEAPDEKSRSEWQDFDTRQHFISIGNFLHEPNWDAVLFLKQEILPLIRKQLPKAELHVYGAYPTQKVFELNNVKEGFLIKGRAEDVNLVMQQARVCIAPLRFGAGLKGKLVDAMLCGTPSVTTDTGAEAMHGKLSWAGKIANSAEDIAQAAVNLYSDRNVWKRAQENGIHILEEFFSKKEQGSAFLSRLNSLQQTIQQHRMNNFTGAMLMQNTTLSSRYMALWIEAKNKLSSDN